MSRLDRGWSTVLTGADPADPANVRRVRNIGADVAVGDWVVPSDDGERVDHVLPRRSAFVRRASFEGARAEADTLAANIDVVFLTHSFGHAPNQRRLERELVLAFDSGAEPVVVLTKADLVDDPEPTRRELVEVAFGVPVLVDQRAHAATASRSCGRSPRAGGRWPSSAPAASASRRSSTPCSAPPCRPRPRCAPATTAAGTRPSPPSCCALPGGGWLVDTPGIRALSLWLSGEGIERAFADVFDLMEHCRFRDCKHDQEPGCAVRAAIDEGASIPTASPASSASSPRRWPWRPSSGPRRRPATAAAAAPGHRRRRGVGRRRGSDGATGRARREPERLRTDRRGGRSGSAVDDGGEVDRAVDVGERLAGADEVLDDDGAGQPVGIDLQHDDLGRRRRRSGRPSPRPARRTSSGCSPPRPATRPRVLVV